jgi:DNA replication protein DnaC
MGADSARGTIPFWPDLVIWTSNKAFGELGAVLDDVLASAILDRLLHHGSVIKASAGSAR